MFYAKRRPVNVTPTSKVTVVLRFLSSCDRDKFIYERPVGWVTKITAKEKTKLAPCGWTGTVRCNISNVFYSHSVACHDD